MSLFAQQGAGVASQEKPSQEKQGATGTEIAVPGVRKLTITGQYRLRYENQLDFDFDRASPPGVNDFFTQRVRVGLQFDCGDDLAAFVQFQDAREWGEETSTLDDAADGFDVHEGWVDLKRTPWLGGRTRIGRQQLSLGDQRLIGALDWKTQARAFDGILQTWQPCSDDTLHAFAYGVREPNVAGAPGTPTPANDDQGLFGAYDVWQSGSTSADFYLLWLHDDGAAGSVPQNRGTLGTRLLWSDKVWEFGGEVATQFGKQGGADVLFAETYAAHAHASHWFDLCCKPWLRLECNVASGNHPGTADNERFNNLFPTAHMHWGMMDLALWENSFNPMLQVGGRPGETSDVSLTWNWFRSLENTDRFGGPNGTLATGAAGTSRDMGSEFDLVFTQKLDAGAGIQSALQLGYGVLFPGAGVNGAADQDTAQFVYVQFDVRF